MPWGSDYINLDLLILSLIFFLTAFSTLSPLITSVSYPGTSLRCLCTLTSIVEEINIITLTNKVIDTRSKTKYFHSQTTGVS